MTKFRHIITITLLLTTMLSAIQMKAASAQTGGNESFEDIPANWLIETDANGSGSTITRSNIQHHAGNYSAASFTTNSSAKAQVRDVIPGNWSSVPASEPGVFIWQRAYVYVPSTTVEALTGNEYIDLAGLYGSGNSSGFYLRLKAGAVLYASAPGSSGQAEFNLYGSFPLDQWVEVELGLWSWNTGDLDRAGCFIVNGKFYGWFSNAASGTNYDRAAMGIVATNSADDLTVYIDTWSLYQTTAGPSGTDNRPTGTLYTKDYTSKSGENIGHHYTTWENGFTLDPTHGLSPSGRIQSSIETSRMPDLSNGWSQIVIDWAGGRTPSWPPKLMGNFFGPMIAFRKSVGWEENLEIVPVYRSQTGTVDLVFESWTVGPIEYASWQLPLDGSGHRIPGQGDIIRVRWEEVTSIDMRVRVDYYDASAGTWTMNAIDHTRALNNVNGVNFLADSHRAVTNTIDSSEYSIKSQSVGTLATFGNPFVTPVSPTITNTPTFTSTSASYTPTDTPAPPTETNTVTPSPTTAKFPPTNTATFTATNTASFTPTAAHTVTPTYSPTATDTPVPPTATFTATNTASFTPTATHTVTPTYSPTATDTPVPSTATFTPTNTQITPTGTTVPSTYTAIPPVDAEAPMGSRPYMRSQILSLKTLATSYGMKSGSTPSLSLLDQSGTDDDPAAYVSFQTPEGSYLGYQSFYLPEDVHTRLISTMLLQVNFKGPASSSQVWTWSIYNPSSKLWIKVGDSIGTETDQWQNLVFRIRQPWRFVAPGNEIRIQLKSNNANGDAKVDYAALHVTYLSIPAASTPVTPPITPKRPGTFSE